MPINYNCPNNANKTKHKGSYEAYGRTYNFYMDRQQPFWLVIRPKPLNFVTYLDEKTRLWHHKNLIHNADKRTYKDIGGKAIGY